MFENPTYNQLMGNGNGNNQSQNPDNSTSKKVDIDYSSFHPTYLDHLQYPKPNPTNRQTVDPAMFAPAYMNHLYPTLPDVNKSCCGSCNGGKGCGGVKSDGSCGGKEIDEAVMGNIASYAFNFESKIQVPEIIQPTNSDYNNFSSIINRNFDFDQDREPVPTCDKQNGSNNDVYNLNYNCPTNGALDKDGFYTLNLGQLIGTTKIDMSNCCKDYRIKVNCAKTYSAILSAENSFKSCMSSKIMESANIMIAMYKNKNGLVKDNDIIIGVKSNLQSISENILKQVDPSNNHYLLSFKDTQKVIQKEIDDRYNSNKSFYDRYYNSCACKSGGSPVYCCKPNDDPKNCMCNGKVLDTCQDCIKEKNYYLRVHPDHDPFYYTGKALACDNFGPQNGSKEALFTYQYKIFDNPNQKGNPLYIGVGKIDLGTKSKDDYLMALNIPDLINSGYIEIIMVSRCGCCFYDTTKKPIKIPNQQQYWSNRSGDINKQLDSIIYFEKDEVCPNSENGFPFFKSKSTPIKADMHFIGCKDCLIKHEDPVLPHYP